MANDRMYMRCKACGEMLSLGKHFGDGWYNSTESRPLQAWIDQHAPVWVHDAEYDDAHSGYEGHAVFEICYESDDDFVAKAKKHMEVTK